MLFVGYIILPSLRIIVIHVQLFDIHKVSLQGAPLPTRYQPKSIFVRYHLEVVHSRFKKKHTGQSFATSSGQQMSTFPNRRPPRNQQTPARRFPVNTSSRDISGEVLHVRTTEHVQKIALSLVYLLSVSPFECSALAASEASKRLPNAAPFPRKRKE